jgi:hypothetical protein
VSLEAPDPALPATWQSPESHLSFVPTLRGGVSNSVWVPGVPPRAILGFSLTGDKVSIVRFCLLGNGGGQPGFSDFSFQLLVERRRWWGVGAAL